MSAGPETTDSIPRLAPAGCRTICMPQLSCGALLFLALQGDLRGVFYQTLPEHLSLLCRLTGCSELKLVGILCVLFRTQIRKLPGEGEVPDYPRINLRAMEMVVPAAKALQREIEADPWMTALSNLIGKEPATAFFLQNAAHYAIWGNLLAMAVCARLTSGQSPTMAVWSPLWPSHWEQSLGPALEGRFVLYRWPRWYVRFWAVISRVWTWGAALAMLARDVVKRGISGKAGAALQRFRMVTEFIEPRRLQGGAYDADYWVNGSRIRPDECLFLVTQEQMNHLARLGTSVHEIRECILRKGYSVAFLAELRWSRRALRAFFGSIAQSFKRGSCWETPCGSLFLRGWRRALEFAPFFDHYTADNFIYLKFPNGNTSWRRDTGIITGLCRRHGIRSVGCQTRVVYSDHYEFAFDCYDLYFSWGPAWERAVAQSARFLGRIEVVGCICLDDLLPALHRRQAARRRSDERFRVTVFTGDIAGSHYTLNYAVSFLGACCRVAQANPEAFFQVKCKDPDHVGVFLAHHELGAQLKGTANLELIGQGRYDYADLLFDADLVIAIGFTTPGAEAFLLNKPTIYYSELHAENAFKEIPGLVVESDAELLMRFAECYQAWKDHRVYEAARTSPLDPYGDGLALDRIWEQLAV